MNVFDVIKTVRITEKATLLQDREKPVRGTTATKGNARPMEPQNQFTLMADRRATKTEIKAAVEELFKVNVTSVNTLHVRGKERRKRTKHNGRDASWKKAIVTLKKGDKINLM
ncbi:MAG: 50S ribosomal protein L23 [Verrucomicrobiae bacterium]|jgi:large subunit ribosomal protein L23|nr:50S ribosomal protein L23 [Verrucomicrobiae bacterium]